MKRKFPLFIALCVVFASFNSCDSDDAGKKLGKLPDPEPIELRLAEKVETDNSFAFDLLKTTCASTKEKNIFISPLSMSMALNMVLNGAKGETADEMFDALRAKGYSLDDINEYSKSLLDALPTVDPSTQLNIANSIWHKRGLHLNDIFLSTLKPNYQAKINELDFSSPEAVKAINNWCSEQTNGKIKEIVKNIPENMMMYLINAIYFKGIWASQFDKKNTKKENFYSDEGISYQVDMMNQTEDFNYSYDDIGAYLELPYGNKAFSMIVMLPQEGKTTDDIINNLNSEYWNQKIEYLSTCKVNLSLPRFKAECKYEMHKEILPEMGMKLPFSDSANFSGMSDNSLQISEVIHKTFVEVNEEGTEAAAVTSIGMIETALPTPIDYKVDRPFLFAIRENSTGVILFIGKMAKI